VIARPGSTTSGDPGSSGGGSTAGGTTLININSASETELEELPGVGPVTAAAIIDYRTQNGPFATIDDLIDVTGIGPSTLEQIRPFATV
jgi:competence protein ComEA